jgi:hypothetical protein
MDNKTKIIIGVVAGFVNLETTVANLTSEQQKLTVQIASFRSMNSIQARLPLLNMVPVAQIKHVTLPSVGEVVMAKK